MLPLLIREEVLSDLELAFNWYESEKIGLGDELLEEWENICEYIRTQPYSAVLYKRNIRQARLHRFPFFVMYEIFDDNIVIYSVAHSKRHPDLRLRKKK